MLLSVPIIRLSTMWLVMRLTELLGVFESLLLLPFESIGGKV